MKGTASSLLGQEVYDWVIGILKRKIVLAKFRGWTCSFFLQRCPEPWVVVYTPLLLFVSPLPASMLKGLSHPAKR